MLSKEVNKSFTKKISKVGYTRDSLKGASVITIEELRNYFEQWLDGDEDFVDIPITIFASSLFKYMDKATKYGAEKEFLKDVVEELQGEINSLEVGKNKYMDFMRLLLEDDDILIDVVNIVQKSHPEKEEYSGEEIAEIITPEELVTLIKGYRSKNEALLLAMLIRNAKEKDLHNKMKIPKNSIYGTMNINEKGKKKKSSIGKEAQKELKKAIEEVFPNILPDMGPAESTKQHPEENNLFDHLF